MRTWWTPRTRLALAAVLFVAWIGYLAVLAWTTSRPVVLSRPQFLVANLYVIAELPGSDRPAADVTVREAGGPGVDRDKVKPGGRVKVINLPEVGPAQGWHGAGEYILPLSKRQDGTFQVTPIPPSPGFAADAGRAERLRIYPATRETRAQLRQLEP
jgi:hypothetical protein